MICGNVVVIVCVTGEGVTIRVVRIVDAFRVVVIMLVFGKAVKVSRGRVSGNGTDDS